MNTASEDLELLRRFVDYRDEAAFRAVVEVHLGLVLSAADRMVGGDAHLAQDVAQSVFTDLARKASAVSHHRTLAGWLHASTRYAAAKAVRSERRRRRREQEAQAMNDLADDPPLDAMWAQVRPVLDEAMGHLSAADRDAVLLRFFEGRAFADIGRRLGLAEGTARMRVERALERLRAHLARRGVASSAAALGTILASNAVAAPPATMATAIAGTAMMASAATPGGATLLKIILMSKAKVGWTAATVLTTAAIVGVPYVEHARLQQQLAALPAVQASPAIHPATPRPPAVAASSAPAVDSVELERLRNEAAVLRALVQEGRSRQARAATGTAVPPAIQEQYRDLKKLDVAPRPARTKSPVFPYALKQAGIPGTVSLQVLIGADGKVVAADPVDASHEEFVKAAIDAVIQWEFTPGQLNGQPAATRARIPILFTLSDPNWISP